jgi:hypothetical protein
MIKTDELWRMWKEPAVVCFEVLQQQVPAGSQETTTKPVLKPRCWPTQEYSINDLIWCDESCARTAGLRAESPVRGLSNTT